MKKQADLRKPQNKLTLQLMRSIFFAFGAYLSHWNREWSGHNTYWHTFINI